MAGQADSEAGASRILELEALLAAQQSPVKEEGEEEGATTNLQMQVGWLITALNLNNTGR